MSNVRSGLMFSFLTKYASKLLSLFHTVMMARLLSPSEMGTFATASSFVMILAEVKLLGANSYLIRQDILDENKIRKAYGMTILMCWGIAVSLIMCSGMLAEFFNQTALQGVFIVLALSFFLAPYISVPDAFLSRNYRFREINTIQITGQLVHVSSTIALIYAGAGFYALAWGQFLNMCCRFFLSLYYTRDTKIYVPLFSGLGEIAKLGVFTSVANIVRRIHYSVSDLVIGKMGSPAEVGMFSRGMGYVDFISQSVLDSVGSVAQPYMSDMKRRGNDIATVYCRTTALLCSLVWPILVVAGFAALPAIRLLFGDQWDAAAPIASFLSVWMIIKVVTFFSPQLLIAVGLEVMMFKRDLFCFAVLLLTLVTSYPYGLDAMAMGFIFSGFVEVVITLLMLRFSIKLSLLKFIQLLFKPLVVAFVCGIAAVSIDSLYAFETSPPLHVFIVLAAVITPIWLALTKMLQLEIYREVENVFFIMLRKLKKI